MNDLVTAPLVGDGAEAAALVKSARAELTAAVKRARSKAADVYKPFHGVLGRAEKLASRDWRAIRRPAHPGVPAAGSPRCLRRLHRPRRLSRAGRRRALRADEHRRAAPEHHAARPARAAGRWPTRASSIRVFDVFPDRVYFTAKVEFLRAVEALAARRSVRGGAGGAASLPRRQLQAAPGPQGQPPGQLRGRDASRIRATPRASAWTPTSISTAAPWRTCSARCW